MALESCPPTIARSLTVHTNSTPKYLNTLHQQLAAFECAVYKPLGSGSVYKDCRKRGYCSPEVMRLE